MAEFPLIISNLASSIRRSDLNEFWSPGQIVMGQIAHLLPVANDPKHRVKISKLTVQFKIHQKLSARIKSIQWDDDGNPSVPWESLYFVTLFLGNLLEVNERIACHVATCPSMTELIKRMLRARPALQDLVLLNYGVAPDRQNRAFVCLQALMIPAVGCGFPEAKQLFRKSDLIDDYCFARAKITPANAHDPIPWNTQACALTAVTMGLTLLIEDNEEYQHLLETKANVIDLITHSLACMLASQFVFGGCTFEVPTLLETLAILARVPSNRDHLCSGKTFGLIKGALAHPSVSTVTDPSGIITQTRGLQALWTICSTALQTPG